jgi:hypothetical protein
MSRWFTVVSILTLLVHATHAVGQNPPASDPRALAYAAQSIAALTGGVAISDVTLTGTASWTAGSDNETGSATLLAKGTNKSRIDLALNGGSRSEVRNSVAGAPQGEWIGTDAASHPYAVFNCWTDAVWFFPALSSLALANPNAVLNYVGQETRNGASVQHLRSYLYLPTQPLAQQSSTMDFYLDSVSFLPVAIVFNVHPDSNGGVNLPTEVDFSQYQVVNGVRVPFHIQRSLNSSVALDIVVTSAAINSGLPDSDFILQ